MLFATRIEPFVAAALDPAAKILFISLRNGKLMQYSYPEFDDQAIYDLGGVATHMALDSKRGLLSVVLCKPIRNLPIRHDVTWLNFGRGNLAIYDVSAVLAGKPPSRDRLPLIQSIALNGVVARLAPSADGKWLYYLDAGTRGDKLGDNEDGIRYFGNEPPKNVKLCRIDTSTQKLDRKLLLADGTEDFCMPPNGKMIYATASPLGHENSLGIPPKRKLQGKVQVIDSDAFELTDTIEIEADPYYAAASDDGLVYVGGGGDQWTELVVVDVKARQIVAKWPQMYMFSPLGLTGSATDHRTGTASSSGNLTLDPTSNSRSPFVDRCEMECSRASERTKERSDSLKTSTACAPPCLEPHFPPMTSLYNTKTWSAASAADPTPPTSAGFAIDEVQVRVVVRDDPGMSRRDAKWNRIEFRDLLARRDTDYPRCRGDQLIERVNDESPIRGNLGAFFSRLQFVRTPAGVKVVGL